MHPASLQQPFSSGLGIGPRAIAIAVVVLLHLLAGWALLRMVILPAPAIERIVEVSWLAAPPRPAEPPKPVPPPPAPVKRQVQAPLVAATPTPQAAAAPIEVAPEPTPPAPVTSVAVPAPSPAPAPVAAPPQPRNVSISELTIRKPASPEWPRLSLKLGEHGRVLVRFLVNTEGRVAHAEIHQSSGFDRLDQAARRAVERAEFTPYTEGGRAIPAWAIYPIEFKLE